MYRGVLVLGGREVGTRESALGVVFGEGGVDASEEKRGFDGVMVVGREGRIYVVAVMT